MTTYPGTVACGENEFACVHSGYWISYWRIAWAWKTCDQNMFWSALLIWNSDSKRWTFPAPSEECLWGRKGEWCIYWKILWNTKLNISGFWNVFKHWWHLLNFEKNLIFFFFLPKWWFLWGVLRFKIRGTTTSLHFYPCPAPLAWLLLLDPESGWSCRQIWQDGWEAKKDGVGVA